MKRIIPRTERPTADGVQKGYFIQWQDTDTHEEKWQEITAEEWQALWGDSTPTMRQLQERFRALAARYGLESDPPRPHTPIMEQIAAIKQKPRGSK